jgi:FAD/FMN-containing dehydrogenase
MTSHSGKTLDEPTIAEFKSSLRGALIRPGDNGYDAARKIHNAMIDRRPGFIVRCAGVADVIAAVNFARSHNLLIAIRGTGHNVAGTSLCDGGLVIDLSLMKSVRIDPLGRRARVEGGASWGELNHDLQAFGLAATGGFISTTGVSGLTLGGGLGWLVRKHSLALDNLVSADVVTADGQLLIASASQNARRRDCLKAGFLALPPYIHDECLVDVQGWSIFFAVKYEKHIPLTSKIDQLL